MKWNKDWKWTENDLEDRNFKLNFCSKIRLSLSSFEEENDNGREIELKGEVFIKVVGWVYKVEKGGSGAMMVSCNGSDVI